MSSILWHQFPCSESICRSFCLSVAFSFSFFKGCNLRFTVLWPIVWSRELLLEAVSPYCVGRSMCYQPNFLEGSQRVSTPILCSWTPLLSLQSSLFGSWKQRGILESAHWLGLPWNLRQVTQYLSVLISSVIKSGYGATWFPNTHSGSSVLWAFASGM